MRSSLALLAVLVAACDAAPVPRVKSAPTPADGRSQDQTFAMAEQVRLALAEHENLGRKRGESRLHLSELRFVNDSLCKRLAQYRRSCPISARLHSQGLEKSLACEGNIEDRLQVAPVLNVLVETSDGLGSFFLKADANYESAEFGAGSGVPLRWSSLNSSQSLPPRLWEITSLKLKATDGSLRLDEIIRFEIRLGDTLVFDKNALVALPDSASTLDVRLDGVLARKRSSECTVEDAELDLLTAEGKADAQAAYTDEALPDAAVPAREELEAIKTALAALKTDLGDTEIRIAREEDRNGKLTKELTADRAAGCFARQKIETLEIRINGAHLPLETRLVTKEHRADVGQPRQFIFRFGEQFAHTHSDEEQQSLFVPGGQLVLRDLGERTIGDIEYFTIEKGGVGIDSIKNCWRTFPFGQACEWKNSEKNIYRMDGVVIKVNGEELYRAEGSSQVFREGSLHWADRNLGMNQAFRALMRRTDCPAK